MNATAPRKGTDFKRMLPLGIVFAVAIIGIFTLREHLSFEALADNRQALLAFRDANYAWAAMAFMAVYVLIVGFSLPGATVATLTGGFLFGVFPGVLFNVTAATIGATLIFTAARMGLGDRLAARMDACQLGVSAATLLGTEQFDADTIRMIADTSA